VCAQQQQQQRAAALIQCSSCAAAGAVAQSVGGSCVCCPVGLCAASCCPAIAHGCKKRQACRDAGKVVERGSVFLGGGDGGSSTAASVAVVFQVRVLLLAAVVDGNA